MAFWASPLPSGLATTTGRIEFVILRTDCSLPVALHLLLRERSYLQLMDSDQSMKGLAPFQSNALTGALGPACRAGLRGHAATSDHTSWKEQQSVPVKRMCAPKAVRLAAK